MHTITFEPALDHAPKALATDLIETILHASDPSHAFKKHFDPSTINAKAHIIAMGKASIAMTNAAIECLGDQFARATVVSTPELVAQAQFKNKFVELCIGDHPLPTHRSVSAANTIIEHARSIPSDQQALVLLSGGASALVCSPKPSATLEHIVETTNALLQSGASIQKINAARAQHDTLKAGGLAKILEQAARMETYTLSDVIGDDLSVIASAPTFRAIPSPHTIIASNQTALNALCAWAAHQHITIAHLNRSALGSAADEGRQLARHLMNLPTDSASPIAVCLGGEPTVDASNTTGIGGPMLELALACALELAQPSTPQLNSGSSKSWIVFTLATDGRDGPTNAAGAIITNNMLSTPESIAQAQRALTEHSTLPACDAIGATLRTGHTGTNVNDIAIAIRYPSG